ncbi:MAG: translocation protein TolB [Bdellovibrionaceae bacterium]|nr:translocation protein TolB [Pseudobdellovibrionaceae bacterium]|tara:strand:+ start:77615 stop:79009 length:1395 start_codon:yes stop_codon:yes gene_type:complete
MKHLIFSVVAAIVLGALPALSQGNGQVYISVGQATSKKSLLALPSFNYFGSQAQKSSAIRIGSEMYEAVKNDLDVSSLFVMMKPNAFLEDVSLVGLKPKPNDPNGFNFKNWSAIGSEFLIRAGYKVIGGDVELEGYVYYVPQAKLVVGRNYKGPKSQARSIAHRFASDVVEALTGKGAMFNSKVVLTANRDGKYKEIYSMDWDGFNIQRLSNFRNLSISPTWSTDGKRVAYTSWAYHPKAKTRNADLFIQDARPGAKPELVSYKKGINSGAEFHPNGTDLYLTISREGNADIYKKNLSSGTVTPITNGPAGAMNVEPAISPDGTKMAFSSDRSGRPMLYVMNLATKSVRKVTKAGHYNSTPSWSPDGKKLAFAGFDRKKNNFDIFIMDWNGFNLERLTSSKKTNGKWANNKSPTFSPDGRHIMFVSDRTGNYQLFLVNADGTNERQLTKDRFNYEKPKWSKIFE